MLSGSMEPTLHIEDYIIIKKSNEYKIGDIIIYKNENSPLIIHRIVQINGNQIITKGDANNLNDEPILKEQIKGKYICKINYIGKIINFLKKPIIFSILITLITYLFIVQTKNKEVNSSESKKNEG